MVAAETTIPTQHAMAGHYERNWVASDRRADGAGSRGLTQVPGDVGIGDRPTHRDLQKGLPDPDLEIRSNHDQPDRPLGGPSRGLEDLLGMRCRAFGGGDELCLWPALHHVDQRIRLRLPLVLVDEGEASNATLGGEQEGFAERRWVEAIGDLDAIAAALVVAGGHGFVGHEQIVQTSRAREADLVGRLQEARRSVKKIARTMDGDGLNKFFWAKAAPA